LWILHVQKHSGSTATLDTQPLLADVFRSFNPQVSKIIPRNIPILILKIVDIEISLICYYNIIYHLENAEITPELCDDLITLSFDDLADVARIQVARHCLVLPRPIRSLCYPFRVFEKAGMSSYLPLRLLYIYSMMQPSSEAHHVSHGLFKLTSTEFSVMSRQSILFFSLLLGSLLQSTIDTNQLPVFAPGISATLYLIRQRGEGYILDDIGLSGLAGIDSFATRRTPEFLTYLTQLLGNPERSGTQVFDQQRYTAAAKECLQLCLCSHHNFSKGVMEYGHRDRAFRRSKPSAWIARMGVHSRIWKGRHHLQVRLRKIEIDIYYIEQ
jgi:hypothetical protein